MSDRPYSAPKSAEGPDEEVELDLKKIALQFIVAIVLLVGVLAAAAYTLWEPMQAWSRVYVGTFGGPGIGLGFYFPDAFSLPLPVDGFLALGLLGGLPFVEIVAWASVGSILGGITGYFVGERLRRLTIVRRLTAKKGEEMDLLVARYGGATLAIAALTPLPYSLACWACGALSMPLGKFTLISLLRIPRVALYLWLIQQGFINVLS